MKLSELAIKNSQFTLVMFLMVIVIGINTVITMPRTEDPELKYPEFPVVIIYPGTSPKDMEELVVKPLEQEVYALEDIKRITSKIGDGIAIITVKYNYDTDNGSNFSS
ncbi:MAG: efflux RND transporter permease subunit [Ignavibacteriae bacterium]|nr:efflux RND transporter permease subunit [Ignavibacteriota bacterium]